MSGFSTLGGSLSPELVAYEASTTAIGNVGGTTLIDSGITSVQSGKILVILSGARAGEMQPIVSIVAGIITLGTGGAQIAKGTKYCVLNATAGGGTVDLTPVTSKIGTPANTGGTATLAAILGNVSNVDIATRLTELKQRPIRVPQVGLYHSQIAITDTPSDINLAGWTITGIPAGMTVQHMFVHFMFCEREENSGVKNSLDGAQELQAKKAVGGTFTTCFTFQGGEFPTAANGAGAGGAFRGDIDLAALSPANGDAIFVQWTQSKALGASLLLDECELILELWVG
jgi:hypothetical protein